MPGSPCIPQSIFTATGIATAPQQIQWLVGCTGGECGGLGGCASSSATLTVGCAVPPLHRRRQPASILTRAGSAAPAAPPTAPAAGDATDAELVVVAPAPHCLLLAGALASFDAPVMLSTATACSQPLPPPLPPPELLLLLLLQTVVAAPSLQLHSWSARELIATAFDCHPAQTIHHEHGRSPATSEMADHHEAALAPLAEAVGYTGDTQAVVIRRPCRQCQVRRRGWGCRE
jgi:hypothetical protein